MTQESIFTMVNSASDYVIPAIVTFLIMLLSSVVFFVWRKFGTKGDAILLVGLNGSGKTRIFTKLISSEAEWHTYTSMMENLYLGYLSKNGARYRLVDYPGAESLRKGLCVKWLNKDRKTIRGIIFVVDSSNYMGKSKDVAEFLYDVLFESNKSLPVLVACNKQDVEGAISSEEIRESLETEFGLINVSRLASLSSTNGESTQRIISKAGVNFKWSDLNSKICFAECSAEQKLSLGSVIDWIDIV